MVHLNDISKIYLEQIASKETQEEGYKPIDKEKENKMYRRAGNLARTSLSARGKKKEDAQDKSSKIVSAIARQKEKERFAKMGDEKARDNYNEALDPVGKEDADVDNDGKKNTKSDKYLMNRRKAIGKAIANEETTKRRTLGSRFKSDEERREYIKQLDKKTKEKRHNRLKATVEEVEEVGLDEKVDVKKQSSKRKSLGRGSSIKDGSKKSGYESPKEFRDAQKKLAPYMKEAKNVHGEVEVPSGNIGKLAKKASKRIDTDVDGDVEHNDKHKGEYGEFVPTPDGKRKVFTGPNRVRKESFSNWRQDLIEVISDDENDKPVKEKGVKNKIVINPEMKEAVEEIGGTVIEMVELDEMNFEINPAAHRHQMRQKKIYNKGKSTTNPNEKDVFMKRTGPQLPLANKSSSMQVAHYDPSEDKIAELSQEPTKAMGEGAEDSLRDRRMERGGVGGNQRYDRAPKAPNTKKFGTGKTALQKELEKKHGKGKSAMDIVKAEIRAKHGKGAIMDTKKK